VDKHAISRREFGLAAGATGVGFAVSGGGAAATEGNAVIVSQGLIETPPTYFDVLAAGRRLDQAADGADLRRRPHRGLLSRHRRWPAGLGARLRARGPHGGRPAIVMTHSMSGAYGWKLVEKFGQHIDRLVAIAPGGPGNIQAVSDIISETADTVVVKSSVTLTINLRQPVVSDRNFVEIKLVGKSTQFPC
jgi:alpha-beta hydrolase superfamily lysophospholipase